MYCIYRITNKINGKTYIGQHKYKNLDDNYMGSGTLLAKAKKGRHGKPFSEETKRKISEIHRGKRWYNDGKTQVQAYECPEGFVPGMLKRR